MKRSKQVIIPRLRKIPFPRVKPLSLALASLIAGGCSLKEEAHIFKTVEECDTSLKFTRSECQTAYEKALIQAKQTAPRYRTLRDCEYEFGQHQCEQLSSSSNYFMPIMAGFMVSEAFRRHNYYHGYNPLFSYYGGGYSRNRKPVWTTADGDKIAKGHKTSANVGKSAFKKKPTVTKTISRGGFGSTASAKSSWGGSRGGSRGGWGG